MLSTDEALWFMDERMHHHHIPGVSVALLSGGRMQWVKAWGQADSRTKAPLTEQHLLYACSMTKFITALTTVALAQAGKVDLDEDVSRLLKSWQLPLGSSSPTLRQLLGHQGGIIDGEDCFLPLEDGQKVPALTEILAGSSPVNTKALTVERPPGSTFAYSDNGYCLVQQVLEDVTAKSLASLVQEYVFAPLGFGASFLEQPLSRERHHYASSGHNPHGSVIAGKFPVYPFLASAGLWCAAEEYALAVNELYNALQGRGKILSTDSAKAMIIPDNVDCIGLGNFSGGSGEDRHIYHLGWGEGFQCAFVAWPWLGNGVVVMTNSQPGVPQDQSLVGAIIKALAQEYDWGSVSWLP